MRNERRGSQDNNSDTESISSDRTAGFSGPLNTKKSSKKSARFNIPGENNDDSSSNYVEITLDIRDDSVAVHSVHPANHDDPEFALLAKKTLENKSSSFRSSLFRNTSSHIKQVSQELKRLASLTRRPSAASRFDRTKSAAAHALKGLKFISSKAGSSTNNGWSAVDKKFDQLTSSTNGLLPSSLFGECIGACLPNLP